MSTPSSAPHRDTFMRAPCADLRHAGSLYGFDADVNCLAAGSRERPTDDRHSEISSANMSPM